MNKSEVSLLGFFLKQQSRNEVFEKDLLKDLSLNDLTLLLELAPSTVELNTPESQANALKAKINVGLILLTIDEKEKNNLMNQQKGREQKRGDSKSGKIQAGIDERDQNISSINIRLSQLRAELSKLEMGPPKASENMIFKPGKISKL